MMASEPAYSAAYDHPPPVSSRAWGSQAEIARPLAESWTLCGTSDETPGIARRNIREALREWRVGQEAADDVITIASELTTNAVVHDPSSRITVGITLLPNEIVIAVISRNTLLQRIPKSTFPVEAVADAESGRGLTIVQALATAWGNRLACYGAVWWAAVSR